MKKRKTRGKCERKNGRKRGKKYIGKFTGNMYFGCNL
jgi:hypothetical protein